MESSLLCDVSKQATESQLSSFLQNPDREHLVATNFFPMQSGMLELCYIKDDDGENKQIHIC